MADDCRQLSDPQGDIVALRLGPVITGSTQVDLTAVTMTQAEDAWVFDAVAANTTPVSPVGKVTVGLYLDVDGRIGSNVTSGQRFGADTVYAAVYENNHWRVASEKYSTAGWKAVKTSASFSVQEKGYILRIPYSEVPRNSPAFFRFGVAVEDSLTNSSGVDFVPDVGFACAGVIGEKTSPLLDIPTSERQLMAPDVLAKIALFGLFIVIVAVILWNKYKRKKA